MAENSNELLIRIRAEIGDLKKGLTQAEKDISKFGDKAEKAGEKTEKFGKKGKDAVPGLQDLSDSLKKAGGEAGDVGRKMDGALNALSKFGKGISSIGPAGGAAVIALGAFGAALGVAAILIYQNREAILEYIAGINDITKAFDKAAGSIGTQIGKLERLKDAYLDSNTSQEDKVKIMAKLQKDYPDYFKSLKDEEGNVADVQTAYENQKKAIVGLGIVKALEAQKAPLYAKIAKLHLKEELSLIDQIGIALSTLGATPGGGIAAGIGEAILGDGVSDIQGKIDKINEAIGKIDIKYDLDLAEKLGLTDLNKKIDQSTREAVTSIEFQVDELGGALKKGSSELIGITDSFEPISLIDKDALSDDEVAMRLHAAELGATIQNFAEDFQMLVAGAIRDTAISLGESIGEALAEGENVIGAMGKSLLGSMGKFLGELGKLLITYGALAVAKGVVDLAISSGFGPVVIAAGAAAIVIGIALVAASSAMAAKTGAGSSSGGGSRAVAGAGSYSGSSGGSSSRASSSGGGGGTYVFEIQGTKLVGVISNTLKRNNALGGGLTISTTPTG